jgi:hypothetical protein
MKNTVLNTLDLAFALTEQVSEFDYVALGAWFVRATATAAAVAVGVVSYLYLTLRLWWCEHGEAVTVGAFRLAVGALEAAGGALALGRATRLGVNRFLAVGSDRAFYALAGF